MKTLVLAACLLATINLSVADSVPVFLWGGASDNDLPVPTLHQLSENEFSSIVAAKLNPETFTVVFQERKLSTEDLATCKSSAGGTCFNSLSKLAQKTYLPRVDNPVNNLKGEFGGFVEHYIRSDGHLNEKIFPKPGGRVFVQTEDSSYAENDVVIERLAQEIRAEYPNTLFIYTGKSSSMEQRHIRKTRDTSAKQTATPAGLFFDNRHLPIYLTHLSFRTINPVANTNITVANVEVVNATADTMTATLTGDGHSLVVTVGRSAGNWFVQSMVFDNRPLFMRHQMGAANGFSFNCANGLEYPDLDYNMYVRLGWQVQASFHAELTAFGAPYDCVGFTSAGIWGGLFVTIILLLILSYGISWMMDIRTMDRFDDPKGKTIIISATE